MDVILQAEKVGLNISGLEILRELSFDVRAGERLAIVGPSGCGKSSLLSLIAGLRPSTQGRILHRGEEVRGPSRRRVILFQNHALFPWRTAIQNVEFALLARGLRQNVRAQALSYLETLGLETFADAYPKTLSGGMQQRVGLARALAADPDLLLLDEPFSALDVITRNRVLEEVLPPLTALGKTLILVTHNIEEALFLGTRVLALTGSPGRIAGQLNAPAEKPSRLRDFRSVPAFAGLETQIYDWL